ncbi:tubulin-like doman-containing protein (plasmid) [Haloarcula sp. NS06]|uniref:tubulin-like doman-containing protein n=1 Tax=Haloarcula sp. NS06 TaxID=3409688 RepID=UPI003DA7107C
MALETPEYILGVGGGGSTVVERFMKEEWIVNRVLNPDNNDSEELRALTIDSAMSNNEREERNQAESEIKQLIDRYAQKHDQEFPDVKYDHYNYVAETNDTYVSKRYLTSEADIQELLNRGSGLGNSWWLNDDREVLGDSGFGNGVLRRRALSKALYHISATHGQGQNHPQNLNVQDTDQICMVVSLGGGTGSGSFIDMAADIAEGTDAKVQLFAIIPDAGIGEGESEGGNELANAHAALSELEYLHLSGDSPFTSTILIPYIQTSNDKHFEEAIIDTILAYLDIYNVDNGLNHIVPGRVNSINGYYPFTLAAPQIIEYDAGLQETANQEIDDQFQSWRHYQEVEAGLYEMVGKYLNTNFPETFGQNLEMIQSTEQQYTGSFDFTNEQTARAVHEMRERIEERIQGKLLESSLFEVVGVPTSEIQSKIFDEIYDTYFELQPTTESVPAYKRIETDHLSDSHARDVVNQLPGPLEDDFDMAALDIDDEDNTERTEELTKLLEQEMRNIGSRRDLLKAILTTDTSNLRGLDVQTARNVQKALIKVVLDQDSRRLRDEFRREAIEGRTERLQEELTTKEVRYAQLESLEAEVEGYVGEKLLTWWSNNTSEFEQIAAYHAHREELKGLLNDLDKACERKKEQVEEDTVEPDAIGTELSLKSGDVVDVSRINDILEAIGVSERIDLAGLTNAVQDIVTAKEAYQNYQDVWLFGGSPEEEYERTAGRLKGSPFFSLSEDISAPISVTKERRFSKLFDTVEEHYNTVVDTVGQELRETLHSADGSYEKLEAPADIDEEAVEKSLDTNGSFTTPNNVFSKFGYVSESVPNDSASLDATLSQIGDDIREVTEAETVDELRAELIGSDTSEPNLIGDTKATANDVGAITAELSEYYLTPIRESQASLEVELAEYGSVYLAEDDAEVRNIVYALQRLIRLGNSRHDDDNLQGRALGLDQVDIEHQVAYGPDLAETSNVEYELSTDQEDETRESSIYKNIRSAESADLSRDPDDIGESGIWENRKDEIRKVFAQSIESLHSTDSRLPLEIGEHLAHPTAEDVGITGDEYRVVNSYLSRALSQTGATADNGFNDVDSAINDNSLGAFLHPQDGLVSKRASVGRKWTLSMVTFLTGATMDMLHPVRSYNGYKDSYEDKVGATTFPHKHHSMGLEGNWERWDGLADAIDSDGSPEWWPYGSAYVHRSELLDPSKVTELTMRTLDEDSNDNNGDGLKAQDVAERLIELSTAESFESLVEHE